VSRETDTARAAVTEAASAWRLHLQICFQCARCQGGRFAPCPPGARLYIRHESAKKELAEARHADRQAPPGTIPLF
jgi:hypothetical protein